MKSQKENAQFRRDATCVSRTVTLFCSQTANFFLVTTKKKKKKSKYVHEMQNTHSSAITATLNTSPQRYVTVVHRQLLIFW